MKRISNPQTVAAYVKQSPYCAVLENLEAELLLLQYSMPIPPSKG